MSLFEDDSNVRKIKQLKPVKVKAVEKKVEKVTVVSKSVPQEQNSSSNLLEALKSKDLGDEILSQQSKFDLAKAASSKNGQLFESFQLEKKKQEKKEKVDDTIIIPQIDYVGEK